MTFLQILMFTHTIAQICSFILIYSTPYVEPTIDINMSEFQYLADHLHREECKKLIAALHFKEFETPNALDNAEVSISDDVPCLQQLLHWNKQKDAGQSESHELVSRRLNQIGRNDLSGWLAQSSFEALGQDFERKTRDSFRLYEPIMLPEKNLSNTVVAKPTVPTKIHVRGTEEGFRRVIKQDPPVQSTVDVGPDPTEWTIFDTISWTIVIVLFLIIIVLMVYLTSVMPCWKDRKKRSYDPLKEEAVTCPAADDDYINSPYSSPAYRSECKCKSPFPRFNSPKKHSAHKIPSNLRKSNRCQCRTISQQTRKPTPPVKKPKIDKGSRLTLSSKGSRYKTKVALQHKTQQQAPPSSSPSRSQPMNKRETTTITVKSVPHSEVNMYEKFRGHEVPMCPALAAMNPKNLSMAVANIRESQGAGGQRTIDIHQKIAIPLSQIGT